MWTFTAMRCLFLALLPLLLLVQFSSTFESKEIKNEEFCSRVTSESSMQETAHNFIDDYHFAMVADEYRNELFHSALKKVIKANTSRVLDVGAGSMLLSMMAYELGAKKVIGVEAGLLVY